MKSHLLHLAIASLLAPLVLSAGDWRMNSAKSLPPLAPPVSHGNCLSYDYFDFGYVHSDFGSSYFGDSDGYGIGFSKSISETLFFTFDYAKGDYDYAYYDDLVGTETRRYRMGVGTRVSLAECIDLTFEGGARHLDREYESDYSGWDHDSWGWYFGPGIRARMGRLEVYAKAFYFGHEGDLSQQFLSEHTTYHGRVDDYSWLFQPGLIYHVSDNLGVKFGLEIDEVDTSYFAGVRLHY